VMNAKGSRAYCPLFPMTGIPLGPGGSVLIEGFSTAEI
jgi:hypothetical protein